MNHTIKKEDKKFCKHFASGRISCTKMRCTIHRYLALSSAKHKIHSNRTTLMQTYFKYITSTIYIIEQSPDNSCPLSTGGKLDSFLPCKAGLIEAGTKGSATSSAGISATGFSFDSSGSLLMHNGFVILILIRDGAAGIAAGVESNSTFPSIELFTAAYVVSAVAGSVIMLSSGSNCKIILQFFTD